jgi:hypothetical protein
LLVNDKATAKKKGGLMLDFQGKSAKWRKRIEAWQVKASDQGRSIAATFKHILQTTAMTASYLEILEVDFERYTTTQVISFHASPTLAVTELSYHTPFLITPCCSLRHLRLAEVIYQLRRGDFLYYITPIVLCLTHP